MTIIKRKASPTVATARIAICDDEEKVRTIFRKALDNDPRFEVVGEASNGREAIEIVTEHQPDALLLDFAMPEVTGVGILGSLRATFPELKIVVISGFSAMGEEAVEMGADAFVSKPVRAKDVIEALSTTLWSDASARLMPPP